MAIYFQILLFWENYQKIYFLYFCIHMFLTRSRKSEIKEEKCLRSNIHCESNWWFNNNKCNKLFKAYKSWKFGFPKIISAMYLSLLFYYVGSNRCTPFFERNEELLFSGNMWLNKDLSVYMETGARISVKTGQK